AAKKALAADRDAARALATQGFEKLQQKQYPEAITLFAQAEARFHAPTNLFYLAQAHDKRGELIEAAALYRKVAAETLAKDAPQPFRDAQAQSGSALEDVLRRTPKLRVEVKGAGAESAVVTVADRPVIAGAAPSYNPGTYAVRVSP